MTNADIKLKLKIGEIEFEAEGPGKAVGQEREIFVNSVLSAVVNAMAQTRSTIENKPYIEPGYLDEVIRTAETAPSNELYNEMVQVLKNISQVIKGEKKNVEK